MGLDINLTSEKVERLFSKVEEIVDKCDGRGSCVACKLEDVFLDSTMFVHLFKIAHNNVMSLKAIRFACLLFLVGVLYQRDEDDLEQLKRMFDR